MYKKEEEIDSSEGEFCALAGEVALILKNQVDASDIARLVQIVFLDVNQAAELLGVKPKTIRAWVSEDVIPYRKAHGKVIFLLAELLSWTLPPNDKHARHRLTTAQGSRIASAKLAAACERSRP